MIHDICSVLCLTAIGVACVSSSIYGVAALTHPLIGLPRYPRFGMPKPSDLDLLANAADSAKQSKGKAKGVAHDDAVDLLFGSSSSSSSSSSSGEEEVVGMAGESEVEGEANDEGGVDMTGSNKPGAAKTTVQEEEEEALPHRSAGYFASKPGRQFPESRYDVPCL